MKSKIKNLVKDHNLIQHLPFGSIEVISKKLGKDRGTIRGVLQGKWVNTAIIKEALLLIKEDRDQKTVFLNKFEPAIKTFIHSK